MPKKNSPCHLTLYKIFKEWTLRTDDVSSVLKDATWKTVGHMRCFTEMVRRWSSGPWITCFPRMSFIVDFTVSRSVFAFEALRWSVTSVMMSQFIILVEHSGLSMRSIPQSFSISLSLASKHCQNPDSHRVRSHNFHRHVLTLLPSHPDVNLHVCKDIRIACNYNSVKIRLRLPVHIQSMRILKQLL